MMDSKQSPATPGILIALGRRAAPLSALTLLTFLAPLLAPASAFAQSEPADAPAEARTLGSDADVLQTAPKARVDVPLADSPPGDSSPASRRPIDDALEALKDKVTSGAPNVAVDEEGITPGGTPTQTTAAVSPGGSADKTGASSQAISVPKGAGTIQGMGESFSTQLSTGVASFTVPFSLPAARGGAQPDLSLSYSSGSGWGIAGMGWDVGVPFIARQTDRGVPTYDDRTDYWAGQDDFVFNGGQELVPICTVSGTSSAPTCDGALATEEMPPWSLGSQYFRPRIEGSFLRFFWSADHLTWRVQDKSGVTMELGVPLDGSNYRGAVLVNAEQPDRVARWSLVRQYDTQGTANPTTATALAVPNNVVIYRYHASEPALSLSDIYDTSPAAAPTTADLSKFAHHTHLEYESRPDPTTSYSVGFKLERKLRLARVDVTSTTFNYGTDRLRQQLRRYHLTYETSTNTSLLSSVQMEGRCGGREETESEAPSENPDGTLRPSNCPRLPAMTFDYTHVTPYAASGTATFSSLPGFEGFDERVHEITGSPNRSVDDAEADFFDLNGDALPDFLVTGPAAYGGGFGQFLNSPRGVRDSFSPASALPMLGGANAGTLRLNNANVAILDLDGDAQVDLLHAPMGKTYSVYPLRSSGLQGRSVTTANDIKVDFGRDASVTRVLDVNGDGLVDVVVTTGREVQTFFALGRTPGGADRFGHAENGGSLSDEPVRTCLPWSGTAVSFGDPEIQLGDMNGDGLTDIVKVQNGKLRYWPGRGNGSWGTGSLAGCVTGKFASNTDVLMDGSPQVIDSSSLQLDDVNGDGLDDLVKITTRAVKVWLNVNGTSWTQERVIEGTPASPDFVNLVRLLDINGSGTRDLVWGAADGFKFIDLQGGQRPWLLRRVANGLGKTTDIEYSTSTAEMLAAEQSGGACSSTDWARPWCKKMPIVTHVVKRVTESDNLAFAHFTPNNIVVEYEYRDPVYDGRQREFRGFQRARSRALGDLTGPTSYTESQFLLGECVDTSPGSCADLSGDNPREALKGLPVITEQYDEAGTYLSTDATAYRLRLLYLGRDGRDVRHAFAAATRKTLYDTASGTFTANPAITYNAIEIEEGADPAFNPVTTPKGSPAGLTYESVAVPVRSTTNTATIETRSQLDYFGNQVVAVALGCTSGAACPGAATTGLDPNQSIYSFTIPGRPTGDLTRWSWRPIQTYTSGDYRTAVLHNTTNTYDTRGNLLTVKKTLAGTLALLRTHRTLGTAGVAPAPTGASTNGVKTLVTNSYDATFGNLTQSVGVNGRCRKIGYDAVAKGYQQLIVSEQVFTGGAGCTGRALTTGAAYDRGLGQVTVHTDTTNQPTYAGYDSFGRPISVKRPLPSGALSGGEAGVLPSVTLSYVLPTAARPYSYIETNTQDAVDVSTGHYRWQAAIIDGLGRTRLVRNQADMNSGDTHNTIEGGIVQFNSRGAIVRRHLEEFRNVAKDAPLPSTVSSPYRRVAYDGFGRATGNFDLAASDSGVQTVRFDYHALSEDIWDAADLGLDAGAAHKDSYASARRDGHGRPIVLTERAKVGATMDAREIRWMYQTSGESIAITRVHGSDLPLNRWMRYDTFGRLVMNVEPHTTLNFSPSLTTNPSLTGMRPWMYAYNDAGDLVGSSDARGCGANYTYDGAGRITSEDYSPCEPEHASYTPPNLTDHTGIEVYYQYDEIPTSFSDVVGVPAGSGLSGIPSTYTANAQTLIGRLAAVYDRAGLELSSYDARGRLLRTDRRLANADQSVIDPRLRFRGRWYSTTTGFDAEDRETLQTTGAASPEFLQDSKSELTVEYSGRGTIKSIAGTYGELVSSTKWSADGLLEEAVYGDAAATKATLTHDSRRWLSTSKVSRTAPTLWASPPANYLPPPTPNASSPSSFQTVLRYESFERDIVGNPKTITDLRTHTQWPSGAKPVSRNITYDDLYRVTGCTYSYSTGTASTDDAAVSPLAAELSGNVNPRQTNNVPTQLLFAQRIKAQTLEYDWLGNLTAADDDTHTSWERGVGPLSSNATTVATTSKPYQWKTAGKLANPSWAGSGSVQAAGYDESGNLLGIETTKVGTCSNGATTCAVSFLYKWDELGRLNRASRVEGGTTAADLLYRYDYEDNRTIKTEGVGSSQLHTAYIFDTLELRRASYDNVTGDYLRSAATETVFLSVAEQAVGRVTYESALNGEPRIADNRRHVFLNIGDNLGSTSIVIDKATSELVEQRSYVAYGATESDYRPSRWKGFREDYGFTGKEEDTEVGLQYFGRRFFSPYVGRWASPDPLAVHDPGEADLNLYAYVSGAVFAYTDPLGLQAAPQLPQAPVEWKAPNIPGANDNAKPPPRTAPTTPRGTPGRRVGLPSPIWVFIAIMLSPSNGELGTNAPDRKQVCQDAPNTGGCKAPATSPGKKFDGDKQQSKPPESPLPQKPWYEGGDQEGPPPPPGPQPAKPKPSVPQTAPSPPAASPPPAQPTTAQAEHRSNQTPSNLPKHEKGQKRKQMDQGNEKGDKKRPYQRTSPKKKKGQK